MYVISRHFLMMELVEEEVLVTLVDGDEGGEGDAERLFKTEGNDLRKRSSAEDDIAGKLQHVHPTQMSPAHYWNTWDGNELDGDRSMLEVGLRTPLSWTYPLDFGGNLLFLRRQSVQSRVIEVINAHVRLDVPACALLLKGEQCCAWPQETNELDDMDGLLAAALYLSLTKTCLVIIDTLWRRQICITTLLRACTNRDFGGGLFSQLLQLFHI